MNGAKFTEEIEEIIYLGNKNLNYMPKIHLKGIKVYDYEGETLCSKDVYKYFGECGNNCKWIITNENKLLIYGDGEIKKYSINYLPNYYKYKEIIKTIEIEEGIKTIGEYSFYNLNKVEKLIIGKDVETIGEKSFLFMNSLKTIEVKEENINFKVENNVLYNNDLTEIIQYPIGNIQGSTKKQISYPQTAQRGFRKFEDNWKKRNFFITYSSL